jgi:hypothetical protein
MEAASGVNCGRMIEQLRAEDIAEQQKPFLIM